MGRTGQSTRATVATALEILVATVLLVSVARAITPIPAPVTLFAIESDPNDYLGRGEHVVLTEADGIFSAIHELGAVAIELNGQSRNWNLQFFAPRGEELTTKAYEGASDFGSPRQPYIHVSGDGRSCSGLVGRFDVLEAVFGSEDTVERLAIDFEVRCGNGERVFSGAVRIRSGVRLPQKRPPTPTPRPDDFVWWSQSQGNDPVWNATFTSRRDREYRAQHYFIPWAYPKEHVTVSADPDQNWEVTFAAPQCSGLVPGTYDNAALAPDWEDPQMPELRIEHRPYRCYQPPGLGGRFIVHEAEFGEFGEVYRFAAEFEQYCGTNSGWVRGGVKYVAQRPTPVPRTPIPAPTDYSTMAIIYSEPGDFIGTCGTHLLTLADGDFFSTNVRNVVEVVFAGSNFWAFHFGAPGGGVLGPGYYENATRWPFQAATEAAMSISGRGRGCNRLTGRFTIHEADFADDGSILRFAADFVQHCEGAQPKLHGTLRFHSSLPPPTLEPTHTPTQTPPLDSCPGDCNRDDDATVDELVSLVNLALGDKRVAPCAPADRDRNFQITVDEIALAIQSALSGCGNAPRRDWGA